MKQGIAARPAVRRGRVGFSDRWLVILALALLGAYRFAFPGFQASSTVTDSATGSPLAGVQVVAERSRTSSDASGHFALLLWPGDALAFSIEGYQPAERRYWPWQPLGAVALEPKTAEIAVVDENGQPIAGADVRIDGVQVDPLADGRYLVSPARPGLSVVVNAPGYFEALQLYKGGDLERFALQPRLGGTVTDADSGKPIPGARVYLGDRPLVADDAGGFQLDKRPTSGRLRVLAPGYRRGELELPSQTGYDVALQPIEVRALYLTFQAVAHEQMRENVFTLIEEGGLNAVVIDIKGDRGYIAYPSAVPLAEQIGANSSPTIPDVEALLKRLEDKNIYTIARIVVFKDDLLGRNGAAAGVDVAIKNRETGEPWIDGENLAWVDPFKEQAWEYNIALAREAAAKGFDEVQFDYIRFPTDPASGSSVGAAQYSQEPNQETRVKALTAFLERAHSAVNAEGAYLGIDTFGYTAWAEDDMGIGQRLATLADHVDYISPMVYPSTFSAGLPGGMGYPDIISEPYTVVHDSMAKARTLIAGKRAVLRPWLQYFDDYPWATAYPYGAAEIQAQVDATRASGSTGFMFWDPTNHYVHGAFGGQE